MRAFLNDTARGLSFFLTELARQHGSRPAVIGEHSSLSFSELDHKADAWAAALRSAGYGPGAHIGLLAGNGPLWLAIAFGVWRSGATLVPLSTFVTARELRDLAHHADVSLLLAQAQLRSHSFASALQSLEGLPKLRGAVALDEATLDPSSVLPSVSGHCANEDNRSPEPIACILYTSGTTGRAKGVMLSHKAILSTVLATAPRTGLDESDSLLSTLPLFWVAGLVIRALPTLATGCALILPQTFTPDVAIQLLRQHRPTALHLRPPQVGQILGHPNFHPDLLAQVTKGGGRSDWYAPHLSEARLITGYGMTEMAGYVMALAASDSPEALRSGIGTPLPDVQLRIVDDDGKPCGPGVSGEIHVRGPGQFSGYYKETPATGLSPDGWFITGDIGSLDAAGAFHFSGRSKDLLRIKGINVSPVEVESVLAGHPDVEAAYVVGVPPDGLDQRLIALIVPKSSPNEEALRAHVATELSHYKRPEAYVFLQRHEVPLGGTSKPQRAQLAALAAERLRMGSP